MYTIGFDIVEVIDKYTSMEKRIRSGEVKTANADRGLIPKFLTKMKDSRECRIKRVFEMVNTIACLYDCGNNPVEREKSEDTEGWENCMNDGYKKVKGIGRQSTSSYLKMKYFSCNTEKDSSCGEDAGTRMLVNLILDK